MSGDVLIIEADDEVATRIADAVTRHGLSPRRTPDGKDGYDSAQADRPAAIVLCAELPKVSGYSICAKLKKDPALKDVPLVFTSAEASESTFEHHKKLKVRADEYLSKPFPMDRLLELLGRHLALHAPGQEEEIPISEDFSIEPMPDPGEPPADPLEDDGGFGSSDVAFEAALDAIAEQPPNPDSQGSPEGSPPSDAPAPEPAMAPQPREPDPRERAPDSDGGAPSGAGLAAPMSEPRSTPPGNGSPGTAGSASPSTPSSLPQRDLLTLKRELNAKDRELFELREQLHAKDRDILSLRDQETELEGRVVQAEDERDQLAARVRALEEKERSFDTVRADLEQRARGAEERASSLEAELASSREQARSDSERLEGELQSRRARIEELEREREQRERRLQSAEDAAARARSALESGLELLRNLETDA